tara:strand:+ start:97 stop:558 length:462 start_codon:yes stop_codon:yes gene_type:complete
MKYVVGIDIGANGAITFYNKKFDILAVHDMPMFQLKKGRVLDVSALSKILQSDEIEHAFIEKAMMMPKNGKISYHRLGYMEGAFLAMFATLGIPYTVVPPATWKKALSCPKDKDGARMRASQIFPNHTSLWPLKKHDGRAEGALIAYYGYSKL